MLRNKSVAVVVALLVLVAFFAIIFDAEAYNCSYFYSMAQYYYGLFVDALYQYGWEHWLTQSYWNAYQYYLNLYNQCGGG